MSTLLKDWLHEDITEVDRLLFVSSTENEKPKKPKEIRQLAVDAGWRKAKNWNVSSLATKSQGMIILTKDGYELRNSGRERLKEVGYNPNTPVVTAKTTELRDYLDKINNNLIKDLIEESIECYENRTWRAAICLSWQAAVAVMHEYVIKHKLTEFNTAGSAKYSRWNQIRSVNSLCEMKEFEFIDVLYKADIIDKNVKTELEARLRKRNSCGHPNMLKASGPAANEHLTSLLDHVFVEFADKI